MLLSICEIRFHIINTISLEYETSNIFSKYVFCAGFIHQAHSEQLERPPRNSGRHHCTYWEIRTTINGQQTDLGLNLQLNRPGFILTYSTNKSMVEGRYALKAYKVSITRCLKCSSMVRMCYMWKTSGVGMRVHVGVCGVRTELSAFW